MVTQKEVNVLLGIHEKIEMSLSKTVRVSHGEVQKLVVADLIAKYRYCVGDGEDQKMTDALETVIGYFLDAEELEAMKNGQDVFWDD